MFLAVSFWLGAFAWQGDLRVASAQEKAKPATTITLKDGAAKVEGALKADSDKDKVQKQPCEIFTVDLKKGQSYKIDMVSKELDSYLRLEDAAGKELAKDDDSGGFANARIYFRAPADGPYRAICTTFNGGTGPFTLTIEQTPGPKVTVLPLKNGVGKVEDTLTDADAKDAAQTHSASRIYVVKLTKGKTYQLDMKSKDVDSFLRLENAAGKELARDDDGGEGHDARILFACPMDGEYRVIATTFFGGTGRFALIVQEK